MSKQKMDTKEAKSKLNREMINGILCYVKTGELPHNSTNSYMNAYTVVQNLADEGDQESEILFKFHNEIIQKYVEESFKIVSSKKGTTQLVDQFIIQSEKTNFLIYWMNRIFTYLDRFYTKSKGKNTLAKNALDLFKDKLFTSLKADLFKEVNKLIKDDRNCNIESRPKIKTILKVIDDLDFFSPKIIKENNKIFWASEKGTESKNGKEIADEWFNNTFEKETTKYAKTKAVTDISSMSAPEYITAALKFFEEEEERLQEYVNVRYHTKIRSTNYSFIVGSNAEQLGKMDTGIPYMFKTKRVDELKKAYQLMKNFPTSLKVITDHFDPYIRGRGMELYENKEITKDPKKFIPELIKLKNEMDKLVSECFDNNTSFQDTKNKAFSIFMNREIYAKQLSNYTDFCMRSGFKAKSEDEVEKALTEIVGLFKCLNNKLTFQIESNKKLSDRLIKNSSLSLTYETSLISKLKQEAGVTYVTKMSEMMSDLEKNKEVSELYKNSASRGEPNGIKLNVQVISQSAWEINKKTMEEFTLPKFLSTARDDFHHFYIVRHSGQKLKWCYGLSKIDIQYLSLGKKYISVSTLPQFLALLELEKHGKISLKEVSQRLGCKVDAILTDIPGLVYNPSFNRQFQNDKGLILGSFNAQTREFKEQDIIYFNTNFTNNALKFNTMPLSVKKSAAENKEIELEEAQITRRYQENILQATITRIMKSRIGQKTTHTWLINETSKQIDLFRAQPQQIKENIEKLIEKNIIKRADKDRSCYEYIA